MLSERARIHRAVRRRTDGQERSVKLFIALHVVAKGYVASKGDEEGEDEDADEEHAYLEREQGQEEAGEQRSDERDHPQVVLQPQP